MRKLDRPCVLRLTANAEKLFKVAILCQYSPKLVGFQTWNLPVWHTEVPMTTWQALAKNWWVEKWHIPCTMFFCTNADTFHQPECTAFHNFVGNVLSPLPKHHQLMSPLPTAKARPIFECFWGKNNSYWFNTGSNSTHLVHACVCCFISANIYFIIRESEIGRGGPLLNGTAVSGNRAEKCRKRTETCRKRAETCRKRAKAYHGVL